MNKYHLLRWGRILAVALIAGIMGVGMMWETAPAEDASPVLATVGRLSITRNDLFALADFRGRLRRDAEVNPELANELLDVLIEDRLVALEAERLPLYEDKRFVTLLNLEVTKTALQLYESAVLVPDLEFDSALIDSYYHANIERYTVPRLQRHIRQITVYKEGQGVPEQYTSYVDPVYDGWKPKRKIDSIYVRLAAGEDFGDLAYAHSEEIRAKSTRGDLGWLSREGIPEPDLREFFYSLPLHMISRPFESEFGWHIGQVTGIRQPGPAPINAVIEDDIREQLIYAKGRERALAIGDSLAETGEVVYFDDVLALPDSELTGQEVMAIVNGQDTIWGDGYRLQKNSDPTYRLSPVHDAEMKKEIIAPLVRNAHLQNAMRLWGFMDYPSVDSVRWTKEVYHARDMVREQFAGSSYAPDSAEIRAYYETHIRDFTPKLRHQIYVRKFTQRDSASTIAAKWRNGKNPSRADILWVGPSEVPRAVWNKLAAVTPGSVVGPLAVKGEYWVVLLKQIAPPRPFGQVRASIANTLRVEHREKVYRKWYRQASKRHPVVRNERNIAAVVFPGRKEYQEFKEKTASACNPDGGGEG